MIENMPQMNDSVRYKPPLKSKNIARISLVVFAIVFSLGIAAFAAINYLCDPYGFFASRKGTIITSPHTVNYKLVNTSILGNSPSDTYQGLIVGGSKSAVLSPALLEYYTGHHYYNAYITYGNFNYYEQLIRYALSTQQLKHIVLHLSGLETYVEEPIEENRRTPAILNNQPSMNDLFHYLFLGINSSIDVLSDKEFNKEAISNPIIFESTVKDELIRTELSADRSMYLNKVDPSDPKTADAWVQKYVLDYYGSYEWALGQLFEYYTPNLVNQKCNIQSLQRIKNLCNAYGVELTVVLGSTFLIELYRYESPEYWNYIYEMAQITDLWDFSYYCDYNLNPYNFFNAAHNLAPIAWQMVMNIYGDSVNDYGQLITKENALEKIQERMAGYYALQKEWQETGTIQLKGYDDPSNISVLPDWVYDMDLAYAGGPNDFTL